ncbi:conserved unknown protein [Ectocarpus siliculosus]|uniref:AB hydrolase-1 domain-containing protein n=1 Tax=Ectocarpus siliculosus TaxID=2880 RepID=D7FNS2_ECTSI|nr:conserved unknown protein [Ectocarpus siliculosus]|eukprot:CBJ26083.1 conserved unknown protein [Ectocarpus siliculosus]
MKVVQAAYSLPLLLCVYTPVGVTGFVVPGLGCRSRHHQHYQDRSSSSFVLALPSAADDRSAAAGTTAAGRGRAREIATQARRRARDARSRVRETLPPSNMQGAVQAPPSREDETETVTTVQRRTTPRQRRKKAPSTSQQGHVSRPRRPNSEAAAARAAIPREHQGGTNSRPPPPPEDRKKMRRNSAAAPAAAADGDTRDVNALVKKLLEEYCSKAPLEEQWPPGRRIRVRGVEIFYKVVGDLSEYGRVISFDRPGFGRTERVMPPAGGLPWRLCSKTMGENPYSADFAAKVLFGVLDRLGVDKVIVVAHSLGAQVALRAARSRPGMIRAMVLVAPAVLNPLDSKFVMGRDPNANLFSAILNLRTRVEMTAKLAAFNLQLLQPGEGPLHAVRNMTLNGDVEERVQQNFHDRSITLGRPELVAKYIEPLRDPLWDRGLVHFYKSLQGEVQPGEQLLQNTLDVWKGPSMIITGDDDPTVPTQSSIYVAEAMEGRLVVVESCSHIPMDERAEGVIGYLDSFIPSPPHFPVSGSCVDVFVVKVFSSAVLSFANSVEVEDAWQAVGSSAKSWW